LKNGAGGGARRVGENEKSRWVRWSHSVSSDYDQHNVHEVERAYSEVVEELVNPRHTG